MTLAFSLVLSGCGPRLINCSNKQDAEKAIDVALAFMDVEEFIARLEIICQDDPPIKDAECYMPFYGSDLAFGRIIIMNKYTYECIIHESYHAHLKATNNDFCVQHASSCGWDAYFLEDLLKIR